MRSTKEKLAPMKASREKNDRAERAFIDRELFDLSDRREWMVEHFEMRLHELRAKGAPAYISRSGMKTICIACTRDTGCKAKGSRVRTA